MQKTAHSTLSDKCGRLTAEGVLQLACPRSWAEMTQEQMRYALHVIGCGMYSSIEGRTLMLLHFTGIEVLNKTPGGWTCSVSIEDDGKKKTKRHFFFMQSWQVQDMIGQLSFVGSYENFGCGLDTAGEFKAADKLLSGYQFGWFLSCERKYQAYLKTKEFRFLEDLARMMFMDGDSPVGDGQKEMEVDTALGMSVFFWYSWIKLEFSKLFPHFFKPVDKMGGEFSFLESYNAQIRALTDGDVTKEEAVKQIECKRALTELDAKAREAEDFKAKYGN